MDDRKPPRLDAGERDVLLALLQFQRESVVRKVEGFDDAAARWSPVGSGTSLLWLVRHLVTAEHVWFVHRFAALDEPVPVDAVEPDDTLAAVVDAYRATWAKVDAILAGAPDLDEPCRRPQPDLPAVNLRWVIAHMLEETARHAGHADVLAELLDGRAGR